MKRTAMARKTPLVAKKAMNRVSARPRAERAEKRLPGKVTRRANGPVRDPKFLEFVRAQPCDCCGTREAVEAHHWGKHGTGTKCSDHEAIPLCHAHHVEGWHRHGTLPGRTRQEWLERWAKRSAELLAQYQQDIPQQ